MKLRRLAELEQQIEVHREREQLLEEEARLAGRARAVSEAWTEVFGGVVSEAMTTGRVVPLEALMARGEVTLKARGLDVPVAPPKTNPPLPPARERPSTADTRARHRTAASRGDLAPLRPSSD